MRIKEVCTHSYFAGTDTPSAIDSSSYLAFKNVMRGLESARSCRARRVGAQFWNSQLPAISTPRYRWANHHLMDLRTSEDSRSRDCETQTGAGRVCSTGCETVVAPFLSLPFSIRWKLLAVECLVAVSNLSQVRRDGSGPFIIYIK